jgi:hypothetical protein
MDSVKNSDFAAVFIIVLPLLVIVIVGLILTVVDYREKYETNVCNQINMSVIHGYNGSLYGSESCYWDSPTTATIFFSPMEFKDGVLQTGFYKTRYEFVCFTDEDYCFKMNKWSINWSD